MKKVEICDTHNDFLTELDTDEFTSYIAKCKKNNVKVICASFWSTEWEEEKILDEVLLRANILRFLSPEFLLHIEDLWWVKDEERLEFLLELKPFSCSLTWNNRNLLAGGTNAEGGLTKTGEECLERLGEAGIVVDLAHLNRKSFWQVSKNFEKNLYCSHTGFYGVKRHKRNLTDEQIDAIVESNGFVGLFFYDKCVKTGEGECGIFDIVKNLKYFTSRWGFDNIGIGTDFYGIENYPAGLKSYDGFKNLAEELKKEGFSEIQIEKIFYKNFLKFVERSKRKNF